MPIELTDREARVIGCLMEKSVITPDIYPLTLNALTNACNQKSSREPVMNLSPGEVQATVRSLEGKRLIRTDENFRTQAAKYSQRLCNTPFSDWQFDPAQFAIMTVLLLRGPRTPGELRANVGRLHTFADNDEVLETLEGLRDRTGGPLVAELPREPGRRDSAWMHLLSGNAPPPVAARANQSRQSGGSSAAGQTASLEARVAALEAEVAELRRQIDELGAGTP
ncbi:MAG: YceH family protein [Pseudomonadales bacterium]